MEVQREPPVRVWGLGFGVEDFGIRDLGFGIRDSRFGFRDLGFGFRVSGLGFRIQGGSDCRVQGAGGLGSSVQGAGGLGCSVKGLRFGVRYMRPGFWFIVHFQLPQLKVNTEP